MNDLTIKTVARAGRLPLIQRWAAYLLFVVCGGSGLAYLLGHELDILRTVLADHGMLVAHGVSASLVLILIGSVLPTHLRAGLRTRRNVFTGLAITAVLLILAISGLMLYYGTEESRDASLWMHWAIGLLTLPVAPLHVLIGRRSAA